MAGNSIAWSGPNIFSADCGIPNFAKVSLRAEMPQSGFEFGQSTSRNNNRYHCEGCEGITLQESVSVCVP